MRRLSLPLVSALLVGACTVGPNYSGPPSLASSGVPRDRFVRGTDAALPQEPAVAQWWVVLADPVLNDLASRALATNPSIAVAQSRVRQARASVRLEHANLFPSVSAQGTYIHASLPGINLGSNSSSNNQTPTPTPTPNPPPQASSGGGSGSTDLNFFNLGLNASWEIDLFGGQRRTAEAAGAQLGAAIAKVEDAQVQLTAEVAQAYLNLRERQMRIASLSQVRSFQEQQLNLTQQRYSAGAVPAFDVEKAKTQVRVTDTDIASAQAELETFLNALAVLTGSAPGTLDPMMATPAPIPLPPASVEVGDPAGLIRRRPDVRAAERNLAAATARIGAAEAARFPRISFMGILGVGGTKPSDVLDLGNISAIAIPQIQWNFLDLGRGAARVEQARGGRDEAEAQYRQAVLGALQDAENALARFAHQRETVAALAAIKASADHSAALMRQRYRQGVATLIDTLDAERQAQIADQNLRSASAALTGSFVAVEKALGLGWKPVSPEPAKGG